jgi:hypothetical protein
MQTILRSLLYPPARVAIGRAAGLRARIMGTRRISMKKFRRILTILTVLLLFFSRAAK